VFWPLQSHSEFSGVPEDSQVPLSGVWVTTSHFPQNADATPNFMTFQHGQPLSEPMLSLGLWLRIMRKEWFSWRGIDTPLNSLMDSTTSPKVKTMEGKGKGVGARSLAHNMLGVEGCAGASGWGLGRVTSKSIIHGPTQTKQQVG
jgi:hypothetical protein